MQVGIVAYEKDTFAAGMLCYEMLQGGIISVGRESWRGDNRRFEADLGGYELGGLAGALKRAGNDNVNLSIETSEDTRHQHALLFAFFDKTALGVENGIFTGNASVCMAHQVKIHGFNQAKLGFGLLRRGDFNTNVTNRPWGAIAGQ